MIFVITGHLGSGKSLMAVTMAIDEYLMKGRRVASNMTLKLDRAMPAMSRASAIKLPAIPTVEHLDALGPGYDLTQGYDESKFGFLLLDEAGTWLNSRDWNDKGRRGLFRWITHARKLGWDVGLIVQDFEALDTQIRRSVTEIFVQCKRLDRIKIPYLPVHMPKVFIASALYGGPNGAHFKTFTGSSVAFDWYDTRESVREDYFEDADGNPVDCRALSSMLPAWHLRGRYLTPRPSIRQRLVFAAGLTAIAFAAFVIGLLLGRPIGCVRDVVSAQTIRHRSKSVCSPALSIAHAR